MTPEELERERQSPDVIGERLKAACGTIKPMTGDVSMEQMQARIRDLEARLEKEKLLTDEALSEMGRRLVEAERAALEVIDERDEFEEFVTAQAERFDPDAEWSSTCDLRTVVADGIRDLEKRLAASDKMLTLMQDRAGECVAMLMVAGMGETPKANCLVDMVEEITVRLADAERERNVNATCLDANKTCYDAMKAERDRLRNAITGMSFSMGCECCWHNRQKVIAALDGKDGGK